MNGNQAYTRGWQMGMQMVQAGAQRQRTQMQKQQFQKEIDLRERRIKMLEEAKSLQEKTESKRRELLGLQIEETQQKAKGRQAFQDLPMSYAGQPEEIQGMLGQGYPSPEGMKKDLMWQHFPELAARLQAKEGGGGFTLGPGQKRFGPEGGEIAAGGAKAPTTPFQWLLKEKPDVTMGEIQSFMKGMKAPSADKLRELDVIAQSAGISPKKLRDGTLTQPEANKVIKKLVNMRKWTLLGAMMGLSTQEGVPQPGFTEKHPLRPLDQIIGK